METNKYTEEYFLALREFIKATGMTYAEFADLAGINRSTFQTMMSRKSEPSFRHRKQISEAVSSKLAYEPEDSAVSEAYRRFHAATMRLLSGMILSEYEPTVSLKVTQIPRKISFRERDLVFLFNKLNHLGQKIAVQRVYELTENPNYKLENAKVPEEYKEMYGNGNLPGF